MVPNIRVAIVIGFVTLSLLPFTNCGQYADPANSVSAASFTPCNTNCIIPTTENLKIRVNMGSSSTYTVPDGLAEFNLGGDCNEGGYPYNTIQWQLQLSTEGTVRTSSMTGMTSSGTADSACVNGRFMIYVYLGAIPQDNFNRAGLKDKQGVKRAYDLFIEIRGKDSVNDPAPKSNILQGRTRVSLSTS